MTERLDDLLRVTALLRERALESYRSDLAREAELRDESNRMESLRAASLAEMETLGARRLLGADTLWQGWLARRRGEINQEIAMSRARKAHSINAARLAFSRDEAAQEVSRRDAQERRRRTLADEEMRLEALSRLAAFTLRD